MVARLDMCCYALVCLANIRLKMKFTFKNIFVNANKENVISNAEDIHFDNVLINYEK